MKLKKKGFTIVELVIVIAVIAILAAVLIPTFSSIIRKANISSDTTLIRNLNTALAVDSAINGKHGNMQAALDAAEEGGYIVEKINATAKDNKILWDQVNDVFCYLNDGTVVYVPESTNGTPLTAGDYRLWVISDTVDETYSTYYTGTESSITTDKGFDAGVSSVTSINYTTTASQNVIIHTNGGTLTINAANSNVNHYGEGTVLTIEAVADASYHEFGSFNMASIKSGRIVVENGARIDVLDASAATAAVVIEAAKAEAIANVVTGDNANVTVPANANKVEKTEVATGDELVAALANNAKYIVLTSDISAVGNYFTVMSNTTIDGNGHTITANTGSNGRGIVVDADNVDVTIRNLKMVGNTARNIQVHSNHTGVKLVMDNLDLTSTMYSINMCSGVEVDLILTNSKVTSWGALNLWSEKYSVYVADCELNGVNDKTYNADGWNDFGTVILEGDTTGETTVHSSQIDVKIVNTKITGSQTTGNHQYLILFNNQSASNTVPLNNCTLVYTDGNSDYLVLGNNNGNKLYVENQLID